MEIVGLGIVYDIDDVYFDFVVEIVRNFGWNWCYEEIDFLIGMFYFGVNLDVGMYVDIML